MSEEEEKREKIENVITDLVSCFLYYDRKGDEDLPRGEIEKAIEGGILTPLDIVVKFAEELRDGLER